MFCVVLRFRFQNFQTKTAHAITKKHNYFDTPYTLFTMAIGSYLAGRRTSPLLNVQQKLYGPKGLEEGGNTI